MGAVGGDDARLVRDAVADAHVPQEVAGRDVQRGHPRRSEVAGHELPHPPRAPPLVRDDRDITPVVLRHRGARRGLHTLHGREHEPRHPEEHRAEEEQERDDLPTLVPHAARRLPRTCHTPHQIVHRLHLTCTPIDTSCSSSGRYLTSLIWPGWIPGMPLGGTPLRTRASYVDPSGRVTVSSRSTTAAPSSISPVGRSSRTSAVVRTPSR